NRSFEQLFGYSRDEVLGRNITDLVVPDESRPEADDFRERVWRGEKVVDQARRRRKDGSAVDVRVAAAAVTVAGEQVAFVIYDDITEVLKAQHAIRDSEKRLVQLMESIPVGVFVLDAAGKPFYANDAARALLGQQIVSNFRTGES